MECSRIPVCHLTSGFTYGEIEGRFGSGCRVSQDRCGLQMGIYSHEDLEYLRCDRDSGLVVMGMECARLPESQVYYLWKCRVQVKHRIP